MSPKGQTPRQDVAPLGSDEGSRHPWLLGLLLVALTAGIVVALATSETSGTGAVNVGGSAARPGEPPPSPAPGSTERDSHGAAAAPRRQRRCKPTESNPGGDNNYVPDAPELGSLGQGFVITGLVRSASGCRPLQGVPVQVWLATETGGETDNRATVRTDRDGRYLIETAPTVPQFGEPNIHVAYDAGRYQSSSSDGWSSSMTRVPSST